MGVAHVAMSANSATIVRNGIRSVPATIGKVVRIAGSELNAPSGTTTRRARDRLLPVLALLLPQLAVPQLQA